MKRFGQLVKEIREEKGIMQQEVAARVGKTMGYISQIETSNPAIQTMPSPEVARNIIKVLGVDEVTKARLEKALERDLKNHHVRRVFPSSKLLDDMFSDSRVSVPMVANKLVGQDGKPRSRQMIQVFKNGLQLPAPETAEDLAKVLVAFGVSQAQADEYRRAHLYDTVYFSRDLAHFSASQKEALAKAAQSIYFGSELKNKPVTASRSR